MSAKNSPWGVKYYEHKCATEEEYQKIAGRLNEYDNIVYTCPSDENEKPAIIILEDELSYNRVNSIREHGQTLDSFKLPGKINDFLANPNKKIIEDLQKKDLSVEISLEGNDVWFSPIGHDAPKSQDEIEYELNKHGIKIWQTITQKDRPGFGTAVEDVVRQIKEYEQRKRMQQHSQQLAQQAQQHKKDIPPQKNRFNRKIQQRRTKTGTKSEHLV